MFDTRRRFQKSAVALSLVAVLTAGMGLSPANATPANFDRDPNPIDLGYMDFPMSRQDSDFIANQLDPVDLYLPEKTGERPGYSDFFRPRINVDPWFFDDPVKAAEYELGDVIETRESLYGQVWYPGSRNIQIRYRSTDSRGYPMIASALLVIPPHATPNSNVFVWAQPINAVGADCGVVAAMNRPSWGSFDTLAGVGAVPALAAGFPVLLPDSTGPRNSYVINRLSSHVILDGIRMTRKQTEFQLNDSKFVVLGISHGGLQVGYTAAEQPYYAPELTDVINRFVIHEGAPDLIKLAQSFGLYGNMAEYPAFYGGFFISYLISAAREYGDKVPYFEQWLTDYGREQLKKHRSLCLPFNTVAGAGVRLPEFFKEGFYESKTFRTLMQVAKDNSLMYYPGTPKVPTMFVHGTTDGILYQHKDDKFLWNKWCDAGANVGYLEIPFGTHFTTIRRSVPQITSFLVAGLKEEPAENMCGKVLEE